MKAGVGAVWSLALPAMLTNVATALFGLADMWVIGRLGDAGAQGAVELGARFMTSLLVVFNFLRTGTTALTAQAAGRSDEGEQGATLMRACLLAAGIAAALMLGFPWIVAPGLGWLGARPPLDAMAGAYIARRSWAVPAALLNGALTGWLVGQRQVRGVLAAEVGANLVHIALDCAVVLGLGWGVLGVGFTLNPQVQQAARAYVPWVAALPLLGVTSFVMDGVFVGAGWTRAMLGTMALSFALFNGALWLTGPMGNAGLWLSFCLLFVVRAAGQAVWLPAALVGLARRRGRG